MSWLSDLMGTGAQVALSNYGVNEARQAGVDMQNSLNALGTQLRSDLQFKPYTVTSNLGTSSATAGGTTSSLSPELQQAMQQLLQGGQGMFNQATQPIDQRATALMGQLEAAAAPSRERERLMLEERLLGQGRLGVQSSMFGGTPESLALNKAIEEQRLNNAILSRQQAMGEQAQNYTIGQGMFQSAFLPQQMQVQALAGATPFAELSARGQQQGAVSAAELAGTGAQARLGAEQQANALRQIYLQQVLGGLMQPQYTVTNGQVNSAGNILGNIFSGIGGLFR